jgi:hypothetical protein
MWRVEYTKEALNYIADNGALIAPLYFSLRGLTFDGLEGINEGEIEHRNGGLYLWRIHDHRVYIHRPSDEHQTLVIALILPPQ